MIAERSKDEINKILEEYERFKEENIRLKKMLGVKPMLQRV